MNNDRKCSDYVHVDADPPTGHGWFGPKRIGKVQAGDHFVDDEGMLTDQYDDYEGEEREIYDDLGSVEAGQVCPVCEKQTCPTCGMAEKHEHRYYADDL